MFSHLHRDNFWLLRVYERGVVPNSLTFKTYLYETAAAIDANEDVMGDSEKETSLPFRIPAIGMGNSTRRGHYRVLSCKEAQKEKQ